MRLLSTIPSDFEPQAGTSNYLKLTPGKHRIRILSGAVAGYGWWENTVEGGRKPHRIPLSQKPPADAGDEVGKFLAFPIYNYILGKIQIWEVTQVSIQRELKALEEDPDWNSLLDFDLEIDRIGQDKLTTRYRITPKPKTELSAEAQKEILEKGLPEIEALFESGDPFNAEEVKEDLPF